MTDEPAWLAAARARLGLREAPGAANNPTVSGFFARLGLGNLPDETPWCAAFVGSMLLEGGIPATALPKVSLRAWARAYLDVGRPLDQPVPGAIAVYQRGRDASTGHVAFWVGQSGSYDLILGGNQSNSVSIMRKAKSQRLGLRWPEADGAALAPPAAGLLEADPALRAVQQRLWDLGYTEVGNRDGLWGSMTVGALNAFRADHGLPLSAERVVSDADKAALLTAGPRVIAPERATGKPEGSRIMAATGQSGVIAGAGGVISVAAGLADQVKGGIDSATGVAGSLQGLLGFVGDYWWIGGGILCLVLLVLALKARKARVEDHQTGKTRA